MSSKLKISLSIVSIAVIAAMFFLPGARFRLYILKTGSMEPSYHRGSLIFVDTSAKWDEVSIGDVVVYKTATGEHVMHRYIAPGVVRGDANSLSQHIVLDQSTFIGKPIFSLYLPGLDMILAHRWLLFAATAVLLAASMIA